MIPFRSNNINFYKSYDYPVQVQNVSAFGTAYIARSMTFPDVWCRGENAAEVEAECKDLIWKRVQELVDAGEYIPIHRKPLHFGLEFLEQLVNHYGSYNDVIPTGCKDDSWLERFQNVGSDGELADLVLEVDKECQSTSIAPETICGLLHDLGLIKLVPCYAT